MRLRDLKIGNQLRLALGVILALVVALGATAWIQSNQLQQQLVGLYQHPFKVHRAISELRQDILELHVGIRDFLVAETDEQRQHYLQAMDTAEVNVNRQLDILDNRYLGPRRDIDEVRELFGQWQPIRAETFRLFHEGKIAEAQQRSRPGGAGRIQADQILKEIEHIRQFAVGRADKFYEDAQVHEYRLKQFLAGVIAVIVLSVIGIGYFLLRGIRDPLKELTAVTEQFRQGQFAVRCRSTSRNELGTLVDSFNRMAETIQTKHRLKEQEEQIAAALLWKQQVPDFCRELLKTLVEHTGSQVGAVYLLNKTKTAFEIADSIGLTDHRRESFAATTHEGEFGLALATKKIQRITDIPADTRLTLTAVSGEFRPREILTIPILFSEEVVAMVSLASLQNYPPQAVELVGRVQDLITARLVSVLAYQEIRQFAERLGHQNEELEAQKRELAAQAGELSEQNAELEMQKQQLAEASRLKTSFLSNMSHELRTPLNSVIALTGVLSRRLHDRIPAEETDFLAIIERNGKNLLRLINDLLDLSRIEAGREEINLSQFHVHDLVGEIVTILQPQAQEKKIALLSRVDGHLPAVTSDFDKCFHILQNLIGNAVKFTDQGEVSIAAAATVDGDLQIAVTDTGIGIRPDQLAHIFDEFRQGDETTSRRYGGTGLGLAIARKYATLLHGSITVTSTPGQGAVFTLRLPGKLSATVPVPRHEPAPPPAPAAPGRGQSILLVEDSEPAVIQMTDLLTAQGYRVLVARNGKEALAQISQAVPDAMILDLMMPEVDGFEVLRAVRGETRTARLPVLILTAKHVTKEELSFLKSNNVRQLIQKGDINKTALLAAIGQMVAPPPRPARPPRPGKPVILAVEDNPDNLTTLKALLQDTATILEALDGAAGVALAKAHQPDLILLDIALPAMDGFAAFDAIRQEPVLRHIPIVALTASAMQGNREQILARGFAAYVSKPIDAALLHQTIRELLDGK